jgi:hypothetical protein
MWLVPLYHEKRQGYAFSPSACTLMHVSRTSAQDTNTNAIRRLHDTLYPAFCLDAYKMPGTVTRAPAKRALAETSNNRGIKASPRSSKKVKLDHGGLNSNGKTGPPKMGTGSFNSSQPAPSQFEETLEKMTQDLETLKERNTEKDQQWRRTPLPANFNEMTHNLVFQQIEAEEGVLSGGRMAVKLFGVTEVCILTARRGPH